MRPNEKPAIALLECSDADLILGSGGSRAILASTGTIMACHLAGCEKWRTVSGVSGGSIPALMVAAGVPVNEIVRKVIGIDFVSKLTPKTNLLKIWYAFFVKNCLWKKRTGRGVLNSEKLGAFVEEYAPTWPERFWTLAVAGKRTYLFTADGVFRLLADGKTVRVSDKPAPVGLAIRATCAVPGVIDGIEFAGELMLDGALTGERCPIRIARTYLGSKPGAVVACDVGEEDATSASREHIFWRVLRQIVCGDCCDPEPFVPAYSDGALVVEPPPAKIQTLDLKLSADQKWLEIMSGFTAAVERFALGGLLTGERLEKAKAIVASYAQIERTSTNKGELAERTQALLSGHGLY